MRCFELTDRRVTEGLRLNTFNRGNVGQFIQFKVDVTSNGGLYFPVDDDLTPLIRQEWEKRPGSVPKMLSATVMPDGESLTLCHPTREALVRIEVSAAQGGKVFLHASNDRGEEIKGNRVVSSFGPFPPAGVSVIAPMLSVPFDKRPWHLGASRLELVAVMMPGSAFRVRRTIPPRGVPVNTWVKWTGDELDVRGKDMSRDELEEHRL